MRLCFIGRFAELGCGRFSFLTWVFALVLCHATAPMCGLLGPFVADSAWAVELFGSHDRLCTASPAASESSADPSLPKASAAEFPRGCQHLSMRKLLGTANGLSQSVGHTPGGVWTGANGLTGEFFAKSAAINRRRLLGPRELHPGLDWLDTRRTLEVLGQSQHARCASLILVVH